MFNIKQFPIFYVNVLGFFCLCSFVSASPIVNYQEKTCEELDDLINRIFEEDLVETKEIKENAEKIYNAVKFKDCSSVEDAMKLNRWI